MSHISSPRRVGLVLLTEDFAVVVCVEEMEDSGANGTLSTSDLPQ